MTDLAKYPQPPAHKWPWDWRGTGQKNYLSLMLEAMAAKRLYDECMSKQGRCKNSTAAA
jgi:hypothetical protein